MNVTALEGEQSPPPPCSTAISKCLELVAGTLSPSVKDTVLSEPSSVTHPGIFLSAVMKEGLRMLGVSCSGRQESNSGKPPF